MKSYIAINRYRSSTSDGFSNTWEIYSCSKEDRRKLMSEGLPVGDVWNMDRSAIYSTVGIRAATKAEISKYNRILKKYGMNWGIYYIPDGKMKGWEKSWIRDNS